MLVLADVENWAWARKARHLQRHLSDDFDVSVWYSKTQGTPPRGFDLYHTFEFPQVDVIPWNDVRIVTGITAHVWKTWGAPRVRIWARRAVALHANSLSLRTEVAPFHRRIYYTPNGVCPEQFHRTRPRRDDSRLVVGHVGKPNPRKGGDLIEAACRAAEVELRLVQRRARDALSADDMREWYQDVHVMAVASDMDGTPNPALEGAACEAMVLSNRIGNMPEFIREGHNGFLVERSVDALAGKLRWLRDHVTEAIAMGQKARATVIDGWTWRHQSVHYRRMWREVLSRAQ